MKIDGFSLIGNGYAHNFVVTRGTPPDAASSRLGQMFFLTGANQGLYLFNGTTWERIYVGAIPATTWGSIVGTLSNQVDLTNLLNLKAPINNPVFTGTVGGVTKSMVGLGNVDNTTDLNKPISTATQTALNLKSNIASPSFSSSVTVTGTPGYIDLPTSTLDVGTPAANFVRLYSKTVGGKPLMRWTDENGVDMSFQPHYGFNRIGMITPLTGSTLSVLNLSVVQNGTFVTPALAADTVKNQIKRFLIPATSILGSIASLRTTAAECLRGAGNSMGGFLFIERFGLETGLVGGMRCFVGLSDQIANATNVDPLTSSAGGKIGMAINANTGNWRLIHNAGGTAPTTLDLGSNFAVNLTDMYELTLYAAPSSTKVSYRVKNLMSNQETSGAITTNMPSVTSLLGIQNWITNNLLAGSVSIAVSRIYLECDT